MFKLFHQITSFGAKDTATKILYLCCEKYEMRPDLNIRDFYAVRDVLASVIEGSIDFGAYKQLPAQTQENIINDIADRLVAVADSHVGTHPDTSFGIPGVQKGKGIDYETKVTGITVNLLFGSGRTFADKGPVRTEQPGCELVAISFSPTLFNNRLELQRQLQETFQQIQDTIAPKAQQSDIPTLS